MGARFRGVLALGCGLGLACSAPGSPSSRASAAPTQSEPPRAAPPLALAAGSALAPALVEPVQDSAEEAAEPEDRAQPLGSVAGVPLSAEELLLEWHQVAGREVWLVVDKLVATRLAFAEAGRLGLRLEPEAVELRVAEERRALEAEVASQRGNPSVEDFVRAELGVEPKVYFERVRSATIRQMLAERTVRAWTLGNQSADLRLIVVPPGEALERAQAALAEGRDFAEVAREYSIDDSARDGGRVPYVVRQETAPLARLAFSTPEGEVGGPIESGDHVFLIRVEELRQPLEGNWDAVGPAVEASLAEVAVADAEFVYWKLAMEKRYPIDLEPLLDLLGASR